MPILKTSRILVTSSAIALLYGSQPASAQNAPQDPATDPALSQTAAGTNRPLNLAKNSPFRDPDIIYLEADELINDDAAGILTARGEVEGRYQDRTLRAEKVVYNLNTGQVLAIGNVVLIDATGATQYATKLELSNELEAGTATDFTARFPQGGITGAKFATRTSNQEVELYNAYYTACEPCVENGKADKPTWRIKARKVSQDRGNKMIRYRDAVFELKGIPVFYTPYLAHPDPSAGRTSGLLAPYIGYSSSKGLTGRLPYFWAVNDSTDLVVTPRVFQNVNPVLELDLEKRFFSGTLNIEGSVTYGSIFNKNAEPYDDPSLFLIPEEAPIGKRLRSHVFADALFDLNEDWTYGLGAQLASDDTYLNRNDLEERPGKFGLYNAGSRRLVSQAFVVGQNENFRFSTSAYGYQSLRTTIALNRNDLLRVSSEDDSELPIIAPKVEAEIYAKDPLVGGRLRASGDATWLTRKVGNDYARASADIGWSKDVIAPGGIEVKPFADGRFEYFKLDPEGSTENTNFTRTTGEVGVDVRWPFIKSTGNVDFIIEPRAQATHKFGDGKIEIFDQDNDGVSELFEDSLDIDLDQSLLWSSNKATGYDFWQKGTRVDVGASFIAQTDTTRAHAFVGQSYASGYDTDYALTSGLQGDKSDLVGMFELDIDGKLVSTTRVRYDDDTSKFRRLDSNLSLNFDRFSANARYYKLDSAALTDIDTPKEEISGGVSLRLNKNWSTKYKAYHDIDRNLTRRQVLGLVYDDQCTRIEFEYNTTDRGPDIGEDQIRNKSGFGIRFTLLTLGDFSDN